MDHDTQGRQIIYIDASSLKDSGCLRKFYWSVVKGWQPIKERLDYKIAYGSAFHLFSESWYRGETLKDSVLKAVNYYSPFVENGLPDMEFRTVDHLYRTCKAYTERYPRGADGIEPLDITALEQKFSIPYWQNDKYVIMLCGTIDLIGKYHGVPSIVDHKTTSAYAKYYFNGYEMDIQTMFYSWFDNRIRAAGPAYLPVVINGVFIKKNTQKAEAKGEFDGATFERSNLIQYTEAQMHQFSRWLERKVKEVIIGLESPVGEDIYFHTAPELAFCRTPFGLCKYFNVCQLPMDVHIQAMKANFEGIQYNPLKWRE